MAASYYSNATNNLRGSYMSNSNFYKREERIDEPSHYQSLNQRSIHALAPYKKEFRSRSDLKNKLMLNPVLDQKKQQKLRILEKGSFKRKKDNTEELLQDHLETHGGFRKHSTVVNSSKNSSFLQKQ